MSKPNTKSVMSTVFMPCFLTDVIIEFSTVGMGLIDGIIISRFLGADCMAAFGIAYPFFSIAGVFSGVLSSGMQSYNSSLLVRGKVKTMQGSFTMTTLLAFLISAVLTILMLAFTDGFSWLLGARGNAAVLMEETSDYLRGLAVGCVPIILTVIISSGVCVDGGGSLARRASLIGAVSDVVFDMVAVKLGWGMFGMGLASSICAYVNLAVLLLYFCKKGHLVRFSLKKIPWEGFPVIFNLGSEKAVRRVMNIIRPLIMNSMIIAAGGTLGMSALSIRNNIGNFLEIPMTGIASAVGELVGVAGSEKNKEDCKEVIKTAHRYTAVYGAAVLVLVLLSARKISAFFVDEPGELMELVVFSMYCLAVEVFFSTLLNSRISFFQATEQMVKCRALTVLSKCAVIIPCAFVLTKLFGSYGVIASCSISPILIFTGIALINVFRKKGSGKIIPTLEDYLALGGDFDVKPQDIIELSILTEEEAVLSAEQVQLFCKGHKFDDEKGYRASLCIEELTVNIIQHGFTKTNTVRPIELRIVISGDDLIIRIRDYCPRYDVTRAIRKISDDNNPEAHTGLKIIAATAKKLSYVNLFTMNETIISI